MDKSTIINCSAVDRATPEEYQNCRLGEVFPCEPQELWFQVFPTTLDNLAPEPHMNVSEVIPPPELPMDAQPSDDTTHPSRGDP